MSADTAHLADWTTLGQALVEAGFHAHAVAAALELPDLGWGRLHRTNLVRPNRAGGRLGTLVELLVRGAAVELERAREALPPVAWSCGALEDGPRGTRARWLVLPVDGHLVLADREDRSFADDDGLYTPDSTSLMVRRSLPSSPVDRHLDLGCGSGAVTVRAASFARQTVGVDLNPRAAPALARTAALNGIEGVTVVTDDAPAVAGRFDRVTFTCPLGLPWVGMVEVPLHTVARDAGLLARFLAGLPERLAPGGAAFVFCQSWVGGPPLPVALDRAFGDRPWKATFWWTYEDETRQGRQRLGLLAVWVDAGWGWREEFFGAASLPPDRWAAALPVPTVTSP